MPTTNNKQQSALADHLKAAIVIAGITTLVTGICANLYASFRLNQMRTEAYRPTDRYSTGKRYESNINVVETTRFGDLCALSGAQSAKECAFSAGPRTALFQTDSRGWKTSESLEKADFVIAGDSFLAALGGDSNQDQLGQQLRRLSGKRFYEAAHPGDPGDYLSRIQELDQEKPTQSKYILLIFEGNDLAIKQHSAPLIIPPRPTGEKPWLAATRHALDRWILQIKHPPINKLLSIYRERDRLKGDTKNDTKSNAVFTANINHQKQAFYSSYASASNNQQLSLPLSLATENLGYLKNKIKCLIFVPTKYSVYLNNEPLRERHPLLVDDFKKLNTAGIATLDLTPALRKEARQNPRRELWWPDDTHWNKNGIATAATAISEDKTCLN